jgi:NADH-quinone oxidoreductase subunit H
MDQLTRFAWKFLVPLALINLANAAFWSLTAQWSGPLQIVRWLVSAVVVVGPFILMGRKLSAGVAPRVYRYAT